MNFQGILPLTPGLNAPQPTHSQAVMMLMPRQTRPTAPVGPNAVQQGAAGSAAAAARGDHAPGQGAGGAARSARAGEFRRMAETFGGWTPRPQREGSTAQDNLLAAVKVVRGEPAGAGEGPRVTA